MSNLTISVDSEILKQARIRAIEQGTSVNAEIRRFLVRYSGIKNKSNQLVKDILDFSEENHCDSNGRQWRREDIYQERLNRC